MSDPLILPQVRGNIAVGALSNWSGPESEGRWSLTHTSSAQFNVTKPGIYTLRYEGILPFPSQTLNVSFDGRPLAAFAHKPNTTTGLPFRQVIDLPLKLGSHNLLFQTDHSNSDGSVPGMEGDRRDLGVKLSAWSLVPVHTLPNLNYQLNPVSLSESPSDTFPGMSGSQYLPVGQTGLNLLLLPSQKSQTTTLTFQIQPATVPQTFYLSLNGVVKTWTSYRGEAIRGDLDVTQQAQNGLVLSLRSQTPINNSSVYSYLVDQSTLNSEEVSFYLQGLKVISPNTFLQSKSCTIYPILCTCILIFFLLFLLRLQIFQRKC